jgi:hypothetical protein
MRRTVMVSLAAAAFGATFLVGSGTAQADPDPDGFDNGKNDGWVCSDTEICFYENVGSDESVKQFWYGANHWDVPGAHGPYTWYLKASNTRGSHIRDNAREIWNRDSECTVYIWDIDASGIWRRNWHTPRGVRMPIPAQNNGHSRCSHEGDPRNR